MSKQRRHGQSRTAVAASEQLDAFDRNIGQWIVISFAHASASLRRARGRTARRAATAGRLTRRLQTCLAW